MVCARFGAFVVLFCFTLCAWAQSVENILLITYDGLRFQEVFGGADERLLDPEAKAVTNRGEVQEKYWADTPEARRERLLPFLWNVIAKDGQIFGHAESGSACVVTNGKNFSYPGYSELLTGFADDRIDSNAKRDNPNVTVLEWLNKQPELAGKVVAFGSWDVFPYIINAKRSGLHVDAGWEGDSPMLTSERAQLVRGMAREFTRYWGSVRFDPFTFYPAVEYIKTHQPRVIYIAFGETDDWAHDGEYDLYLDSARQTDDYIRRLWELVQSLPQYAGKTAMLISTDHGRGDTAETWTSHGATTPTAERIWIAAMGPGIAGKGVVEESPTTQSQFAATAAALLGLDYKGATPEAAAAIEF